LHATFSAKIDLNPRVYTNVKFITIYTWSDKRYNTSILNIRLHDDRYLLIQALMQNRMTKEEIWTENTNLAVWRDVSPGLASGNITVQEIGDSLCALLFRQNQSLVFAFPRKGRIDGGCVYGKFSLQELKLRYNTDLQLK
jgi:hypothetical protein